MELYNLLNQKKYIPVINEEMYKDFPDLEEEWFCNMESVSSYYGEFINIFPHIRKSDKNIVYIDIYVYEYDDIQRFVFIPGHKLETVHEKKYLFYIRNQLSIIHFNDHFLSEIRKRLPNVEIQLLLENKEYNVLLEMIYFLNYPSGLKEILYKANLPHIAYNLYLFNCVNLIGTTPKEIFDMPIKCLRYFEHSGMDKQIRCESERKLKAATFKQFSSFICQFDFLTEYQWKYLEDLTIQRTGGKGIFPPILNKKLFLVMAKCTKNDYAYYKRFYSFDKKFRDFMECENNPSLGNLFSELEKLEVVEELLQKSDYYNNFFEAMYEITKNMKASDEKYNIEVAKSIEEYIVFARRMNNCLITGGYIKDICSRKSQILFFIPHTKNTNMQLAVEIRLSPYKSERRVLQAYGYDNRHLSLKEIISVYNFCQLKKVIFDVNELISEYSNDSYDDLYDGELDEIYNWFKKISSKGE